MNKKYVISDLHGQFVLLQLLLEKIAFDDSDELYVLGDIMDRGPNSIDIYYFIKSMNNIHMIKGNHEIMMRTSLIQSLKYFCNRFSSIVISYKSKHQTAISKIYG